MLSRRLSVAYWTLFLAWQATGFWLIFGPLVITSQHRHEYLGLDVLTPGDLVAAMCLMGSGIPERQGFLLGSLTIFLVNYLLALGVWRLLIHLTRRAPKPLN